MKNLHRAVAVSLLGLVLGGCGTSGPTTQASSTPTRTILHTSDPTAVTSPTAEPTMSATPAPTMLRWSGDGLDITISNATSALSQTTPDFRAFIHQQLDDIWNGTGGPSCRSSAHIYLTAYSSAGFALASNEGMYGMECAGGGNAALYAQINGVWKEAIGTQEAFSCSALATLKVPANLAKITCANADGSTQIYAG